MEANSQVRAARCEHHGELFSSAHKDWPTETAADSQSLVFGFGYCFYAVLDARAYQVLRFRHSQHFLLSGNSPGSAWRARLGVFEIRLCDGVGHGHCCRSRDIRLHSPHAIPVPLFK
jgi:hypothetical protein